MRPAGAHAPDAVVVSHLHPDHLDVRSLHRLPETTRLVVPAGAGEFVRRRAGDRCEIEELARGETTTVGGVTIAATPANHGSQRYPWFGRLSAPPLGFVVEGSSRIYFAGDTDLFPEMADLDGGLDLALLPVGGWGPTLGPGHLDPQRAAQALALLGARQAVPVHWGSLRVPGLWRLNVADYCGAGEAFRRASAVTAPEATVTVLEPTGGAVDVTSRR